MLLISFWEGSPGRLAHIGFHVPSFKFKGCFHWPSLASVPLGQQKRENKGRQMKKQHMCFHFEFSSWSVSVIFFSPSFYTFSFPLSQTQPSLEGIRRKTDSDNSSSSCKSFSDRTYRESGLTVRATSHLYAQRHHLPGRPIQTPQLIQERIRNTPPIHLLLTPSMCLNISNSPGQLQNYRYD